MGLANQIKSPAVQNHYREHFRNRMRTLFAPARKAWVPGGRNWPPGRMRPGFGRPLQPEGDLGPMTSQIDRTERALLTAVVAQPWLLEEHGEVFAALAFPQAVLDSIKSRIREEASRHPGDRKSVVEEKRGHDSVDHGG